MFYKVISDGKIIDVLNRLSYVKIQVVHNCLIVCDKKYAEGILSSNGNDIWFVEELIQENKNNYPTVKLTEIEESEYNILLESLLVNESIEEPEPEIEEPEITEEDIITVEFVRESKINEMSNTCNKTISDGFDVILSDNENHHFSLTMQDQLNLITLSNLVANGETMIPYHADNELCKYYSVEDITSIVTAATAFKTYHTTYFNTLKQYINSLKTIDGIGCIYYGVDVPEEYCSDVLVSLLRA